jgi:Sensors of blue-light using FAD
MGPINARRTRKDRDLVQIAYVSIAAVPLSPAELEAMAAEAEQCNAAARVTGLLLHHGIYFYAILEGPRRRVLGRIEDIIAERKERELRILREESVSRRRFENWTFGVLPASLQLAAGPSEFLREFCGLLE